MKLASCFVVVALGCSSHTARAAEPARAPLSPARRAVSVGTAVVPGLVVHGTGHFVARQPKTGRKLLAIGTGGLVLAAGSVIGIALTGASRRFTAPLASGLVLGLGAFALTFLADVYGVSLPDHARGAPRTWAPWLVLESGFVYRYDRQFEGRLMFHQGGELLLARRHQVRVELDSVPGDPSARLRGLYGYRVWHGLAGDGSYLAVEAGALHQTFSQLGFRATTFEAALHGRWDLRHLGPSLRGAFVEGRLGGAASALWSRGGDTDADQLLLLRWGFGAYLGHGRGEVEAYYDHRRDTYAGGLLLDRGRSGYAGFVGARGQWYFTDRIGLRGEAQVGSALLAGVSILFREGGTP